jgi:hypothetical protein
MTYLGHGYSSMNMKLPITLALASVIFASRGVLAKSIRNSKTREKTRPPRFVEVDGLIRYRLQDLNALVGALESKEVI